jgi:hypothetical protein
MSNHTLDRSLIGAVSLLSIRRGGLPAERGHLSVEHGCRVAIADRDVQSRRGGSRGLPGRQLTSHWAGR